MRPIRAIAAVFQLMFILQMMSNALSNPQFNPCELNDTCDDSDPVGLVKREIDELRRALQHGRSAGDSNAMNNRQFNPCELNDTCDDSDPVGKREIKEPLREKRAANKKTKVYKRSGVLEEPVIPESCLAIGICDDIPNYPEELVSNILSDLMKDNSTRFNKDVLEPPQITQRAGSADDVTELCDSKETIYAPRAALDANMHWHVIVNDKKRPVQTFRIEICNAIEAPCSPVAFFQEGYKATCIQKFMLRNMLSIDDQQQVVEMPFRVPVCCSCVAGQM